jgi:hypothetical protein
MTGLPAGPKVDVEICSGTVRATVHPRPHWLGILVELCVALFFAGILQYDWTNLALWIRVLLLWGVVSTVPLLVYQFFGEEVIEFDSQKLTIRKGIRGWERKREYQIQDCKELEWEEGSEGTNDGFKLKVRWRSISFGEYLPEDDAIAIMKALQNTLPDVAQKICAYPEGKEHFITLGLNRQ